MKTIRNICSDFTHIVEKARTNFANELCEKIREGNKDGILPLEYIEKNTGIYYGVNYLTIEREECLNYINKEWEDNYCRIIIKGIDAMFEKIIYTYQTPDGEESELQSNSILLFPADELYLISQYIYENIDELSEYLTNKIITDDAEYNELKEFVKTDRKQHLHKNINQ